ncbi:MAG: D-tyrosyl-tRNA(Tyr) deacylase [Flavobacteriales bacterium]|nr:D-tyrosyl-tRNA(Tyr) deacylase [Flavobacteriales bacterium]
MRAVIQRVSEARVRVHEKEIGGIGIGYLILLGIEEADGEDDVEWLANKVVALRVFSDEEGLMNRSITDVDGQVLVVSQFTLHAKYKKGNRPSFIRAAKPLHAIPVYESFCDQLERLLNKPTQRGEFGADMDVHLVNDGPVTLVIDTKNKE